MTLTVVLLISAIAFVIVLTLLGLQPKIMNRLIGWIICITGIAGILLYGYGYYCLYGPSPITVMRTLFSVFCMFLGRNEISAISAVPLLATEPAQVILYLTHLTALYCTTSAVIAGIGTRLIRILNLWSARRKDSILIYGVNEESVRFGEKLRKERKTSILFIGTGSCEESLVHRILQTGGVLLDDDVSVTPGKGFLKKIGLYPGRQSLTLFCLDKNTTNNMKYAGNLSALLEKDGILPSQTSVSILVPERFAGEKLQAQPSKYGFGSVNAIEAEELAARIMIRRFPPYAAMRFGERAVAAENFEAVIIGFGRTGQAVLRALIMNSQFAGSTFHATVIADQYSRLAGNFFYAYPGIRENYHIDFLEINARSVTFYDRLSIIGDDLNYIAVCTGNEQENNEIASELHGYLKAKGSSVPVIQCTGRRIMSYSESDGIVNAEDVLSPDILCTDQLDQMAMLLNHKYHQTENNSIQDDWNACDYFSRESCRASADFMDAMIAAAGSDRERIAREGWPDDPVVLENLSMTEHLRWCAFHFANGYTLMTPDEFEKRGERYLDEKKGNGNTGLRIAKNPERHTHACLVPWDELDEIAKREAVYTGVRKDYKKLDYDNVLMIPECLAELKKSGEGV